MGTTGLALVAVAVKMACLAAIAWLANWQVALFVGTVDSLVLGWRIQKLSR